jgi:hypothetical protein
MGSEWILGRLAWGVVDWIRLAQDRDRWRADVSAVINKGILSFHILFIFPTQYFENISFIKFSKLPSFSATSQVLANCVFYAPV